MAIKTLVDAARRAVKFAIPQAEKAPQAGAAQVETAVAAGKAKGTFAAKDPADLATKRPRANSIVSGLAPAERSPSPKGYRTGENLTGAERRRFDRPMSAKEQEALQGAPSQAALHLWLRRVQTADVREYQKTLKRLVGLPPQDRVSALHGVAAGVGNDLYPPTVSSDLKLAGQIERHVKERAESAYRHGEGLTGAAKTRFRRPLEAAEQAYVNLFDSAQARSILARWLRRVEHQGLEQGGDPQLYQRLLSTPPSAADRSRLSVLINKLDDVSVESNVAADVGFARQYLAGR